MDSWCGARLQGKMLVCFQGKPRLHLTLVTTHVKIIRKSKGAVPGDSSFRTFIASIERQLRTIAPHKSDANAQAPIPGPNSHVFCIKRAHDQKRFTGMQGQGGGETVKPASRPQATNVRGNEHGIEWLIYLVRVCLWARDGGIDLHMICVLE